MAKQLDLFTTPTRIGALTALCLIELALKRQVILTQDDLNELEHVVIDMIRRLEDELLAAPITLEDVDDGVSGD